MEPIHVLDWSAWAPDRASKPAWRAWATGVAQPDSAPEPPVSVPVLLRRRVSPLGQQALRAAWGQPGADKARFVFCSRDGEFGRTVSILESITRTGAVSPADFTLSVHHALAGLLSIALRNQAGHTTVAAGTDSFGAGMQEAIGCLAEQPDEPVLLVHFHEPLPPPYACFGEANDSPFALVLMLAAHGDDPIVMNTASAGTERPPSQPLGLGFLRFLLNGADRISVPGDRVDWHWQRADAAP